MVINIIITVEPVVEPVSLQEIYDHLRLDAEGSPAEHPLDDLLLSHIAAARALVEQHIRRALGIQTLKLTTDAWGYYVELFKPPVISITSVKYYDTENVLQTVASADYFITNDFVPRLQFNAGFTFPQTYDRSDAVQVTYVVGQNAATVPQGIKAAIKLHVQLLYDELAVDEQAAAIRAIETLLASYRVHGFGRDRSRW